MFPLSCAGECNAGELRHPVELHAASSAKDTAGTGEDIITYAKYDDVWASVRPMQGGELESAQQISEVVTHKIRIWYNQNIVPTDRIIFDGRTFEIFNILDFQERKIYQDILCKEKVD